MIEHSHLGSLGRKGICALGRRHERVNRRPLTDYQTRRAGRLSSRSGFWISCCHHDSAGWSGFEISQNQMLKDIFENRLYGQKVVVSGSVFGSILSEIQNIAIVFTCNLSQITQKVRYQTDTATRHGLIKAFCPY